MMIIAGKAYVDPRERDEFVHAFSDFVVESRGKRGCLDFSVSPDPAEPGRVNLFERWEDEETLRANQETAQPPAVLSMVTEMEMEEYDATVRV